MNQTPEESQGRFGQPGTGADGDGAGVRLWAAGGLSAAAVLIFVSAAFPVPDEYWPFLMWLFVALGLGAALVYLARVGLRRTT